jgi:hypothetical protein
MASQLGFWSQQIHGRKSLPEPPLTGLQLPDSWEQLGEELNNPTANRASLQRLERIASRLMLCRQAAQAIRDGEANWAAILGRA